MYTNFADEVSELTQGFASDKGLSKKDKKQIASYLLELGLIDENKLNLMIKQYQKLDKQQQDKLKKESNQ